MKCGPTEVCALRSCRRDTLKRGLIILGVLALLLASFRAGAADPPPALRTVRVPEPPNLFDFVEDKEAAIRLGKALFWDMQVGSDGIQACASCHFHAGADNRIKNQISPGLLAGDNTFQFGGPNYTLKPEDFPLRKLADPDDRKSAVLRDTNDTLSSQGVFSTKFLRIRRGLPTDATELLLDSRFLVGDIFTRKVEPRNSPTVINAVFNFDNFWDGRANFHFNGVNPFGPLDINSGIFMTTREGLQERHIRIPFASLASQAVGPPLSDFEMSGTGRVHAIVARKLLSLRPLAKQLVHPQDSVLGSFSRARLVGNQVVGLPGLKSTYTHMVRSAFLPEYWNSDKVVKFTGKEVTFIDRPDRPLEANEFTHMEANFSLFFGLSIQLYEATLVSDDTPFDRFRGWDGRSADPDALTPQQKLGLEVFLNQGKCINCHNGPEFSGATVRQRLNPDPPERPQLIELMPMAEDVIAFYDGGFYNIATRPTNEDIGRGGTAPFINPRTGQPFPLSRTRLAMLKEKDLLPPQVARFVPDLPGQDFFTPRVTRTAVDGAMKVPTLRNVELTAPYFHNGGSATLMQVVQFYNRGGDFHEQNIDNLDPDIQNLGLTDEQKAALVAFMLALTDERVRQEMAPFDHPQLFIPHGQHGDHTQITGNEELTRSGFKQNEQTIEIPPLGGGGRPAAGLPPLGRFLGLDPFQP